MKKWGTALLALFCTINLAQSATDTIRLFPLTHYDQSVTTWIHPTEPHYTTRLLSAKTQEAHFSLFFQRYFGQQSPWNPSYVNHILHSDPQHSIATTERAILATFDNTQQDEHHIGYGANFRPYPPEWLHDIQQTIPLTSLAQMTYHTNRRGILIDNAYARYLPTLDPYFYSAKIAGEGYPFDNLQVAALWIGTPVYVITETIDHAWSLVLSPDVILWIPSNTIAHVDQAFVTQWQQRAKHALAAITQHRINISDHHGRFLFTGYIGTVLPAEPHAHTLQLFVPIADSQRNARITTVSAPAKSAALMPLTPTPQQFAKLMQSLVGVPYGWGNYLFYNDCSAELKNLFAPFGIWLPNHSSLQVKAGHWVNLSQNNAQQRLQYLMQHGRGFVTIVYMDHHIVLYLGNYPNPQQHGQPMAMTYQSIWGLKPKSGNYRAVIGKAVFLPMLLEYPEDTHVVSLAGKSAFQIGFLDEMPSESMNTVMNVPNLMQLVP